MLEYQSLFSNIHDEKHFTVDLILKLKIVILANEYIQKNISFKDAHILYLFYIEALRWCRDSHGVSMHIIGG